MIPIDGTPALDRRTLLRNVMLLVGSSTLAFSDQIFAQTGAKQVRFLDAPRYATLDAIAETIIPRTDTPGARDAGVPTAFDALLRNWASPTRRAEFQTLLDDVDRVALAEERNRFAALAPARQFEILKRFDREQALKPDYMRFKMLILTLYYLSEPGATQELRYEHSPGVWKPSIKVTDQTRAWAV